MNIICLFSGHKEWRWDPINPPISLIQAASLGNEVYEFRVCSRCNQLYGNKGQLSAQELAAEKAAAKELEKYMQDVNRDASSKYPKKEEMN